MAVRAGIDCLDSRSAVVLIDNDQLRNDELCLDDTDLIADSYAPQPFHDIHIVQVDI